MRSRCRPARPNVDGAGYDYRLLSSSAAVNAGVEPGAANGVPLRPEYEYVHVAGRRDRVRAGTLDIGAYELHE